METRREPVVNDNSHSSCDRSRGNTIRPTHAASYFQTMPGTRGFLILTTIVFVAIGASQGVVVSVVSHLDAHTAVNLAAMHVVVALFWVPIAMLTMWLIDAELAKPRRI